ncbi:SDR family oxidoreductase [Nonomuraea phyllanthi]|uniref:SDR family oxidoreductase n=1 Tax=Nonomuraea phyllanthi TaxID=2219224 RepID=A0A5C4WIP9_9ACTN|nr:SDR family oxidoreductase [Nonomuraea phyllanthi]KAB8194188.1 SDR family oxidoreductase [Nonomuraea phyllanthi]
MSRQPRDAASPRRALITGAGGGIGAAIARVLHAGGAMVIVTDTDLDAARVVADGIEGAEAVHLDVRSEQSVRTAIGSVTSRHGPLDILVNNAAVCSNLDFESVPEPVWSADVDVVLGGAIRLCQAVLPGMREAGRGAVVNVASVNGHRYFGNDTYSAAKAGLLNLTRGLAVQYGPYGVRVNSVSPGTIATPIWEERLATDPDALDRAVPWYPMGRVGTVDDVAEAVAFLAGDRASWINGIDLPVDGGLLAGSRAMAVDIGAAVVDTGWPPPAVRRTGDGIRDGG